MSDTQETSEGEQRREYPSDEFYTPEEDFEHSEVGEEIEGAINELDEDYRVVIVLRDVQGLSYQEIAQILDMKEGTVKSRIHRARLELQDKLRYLINKD